MIFKEKLIKENMAIDARFWQRISVARKGKLGKKKGIVFPNGFLYFKKSFVREGKIINKIHYISIGYMDIVKFLKKEKQVARDLLLFDVVCLACFMKY
ncbi:MAG TPA: hypothetical protein VGB26_10315 [Nitrospiria bacterium]